MSFVGELNDKMKGFYRSKYTVNGEERYGAVTQFEVRNLGPLFSVEYFVKVRGPVCEIVRVVVEKSSKFCILLQPSVCE